MSFAHLPRELQLMIITNALHTTQMQAPLISTSTAQNVAIDIQQATLLSLVSHSCRTIIVDMLYTHIRMTKPSALVQLHRTRSQSPNLAAVVRSIHLGPEEELPDKEWWGDDNDRWGGPAGGEPGRCIRTTLVDKSVLPDFWKLGGSISIKWPGGTEERLAIGDAVYGALQDIDVEPWRRRFSWSGSNIGVREWTARLFQVQAAFDLYLMEMRRVEDEHNSKLAIKALAAETAQSEENAGEGSSPTDGPSSDDDADNLSEDEPRYPSLEILLDASTPPPPREERPADYDEEWNYYLTGAQIWQHLTRQGGLADNFDHLLLLTRSSRQTLQMGQKEWRRVRLDLGGRMSCRFEDAECQYFRRQEKKANDEEEEDEEDSAAYDDDYYESPSEDEDTFPGWVEDDDSVYEHQPGRAAFDGPLNTVEILIDTATSLLSLTPNLVSLCVTSVLYV